MHYQYRCGSGHTTERIVPVKDWKERIRCRCGRVAEQFLSRAPHPHSGRTIWTASEVHGKKKAASDELREDLEKACLSGDRIAPEVHEAFEKTRLGIGR